MTANPQSEAITVLRVLDTAVTIADRDGLDALSIRNLAAALDVAPMTIYGYVTSKSDLLDKMADHMIDQYELPTVNSTEWPDHVVAIMATLRRLMLDHPSLPKLLTTRRVVAVGLTRSIEATLSQLRQAGLSPSDSVRAFGALIAWTLGFVVYEIPRTGPDAKDSKVASTLRSISEARNFPIVNELADDLSRLARADESFEYGLRCLLRGLYQESMTSAHASTDEQPTD